MSRPDPLLYQLAAHRDPAGFEVDERLVDSAQEHRMSGLLQSAVLAGHAQGDPAAIWALRELDIQQWARNRMLAAVASKLVETAVEVGVGLAVIKGVAYERHAYERTGERPTADIDVVVSPADLHRVPELVAAVAPRHALVDDLPDLLAAGHVQSVDFQFDGIPIDLHVDPLKLEIVATRQPNRFWEQVAVLDIEGHRVPAFGVEASLVLSLLHLNKDRFRYLLGFADVVRLAERVDDWDWVDSTLEIEGLAVPVWETMDVVERTLDRRLADHPNPKSTLWRISWGPRVRLSGAPGRVRYRYRQFLIPLTGDGRRRETVGRMVRRLAPPDSLLSAYYPETRGPYLWRLLVGRIGRRWKRFRQRRAASGRTPSAQVSGRR